MARSGLRSLAGNSRLSKVKKLVRSGGKVVKKGAKAGGKLAYKHPGIVNKGIRAAGGYAGSAVGRGVAAATDNPTAGAVVGAAVAKYGSDAAIHAKDKLLEKHFGTRSSNDGSSHSGRNYAVKRKNAIRYNHPTIHPDKQSARVVKPAPIPGRHLRPAAMRNTNHIYSSSHPTGAKI